jgi:hypothetical protein
MDEAEGKKRIAFWETKKGAYAHKNNISGIKRADDTIKRIKAAMPKSKQDKTKSTNSIVQSERKRDIKSEDKGEGKDRGDIK